MENIIEETKTDKVEYYKLKKILKKKALYNVIFGERSTGKTYAVLEYALELFCKFGHQLGIIRRMEEDFRGKRSKTMFNNLVKNGLVKKYSHGEWDDIVYSSGAWYLCRFDKELNKMVYNEKPIAYAFALTSAEHDKSTSYPDIKTVLFDEFLSRNSYLPDEFILFENTLSTIIRERDDVTIFMLGNTVNKYSPYFKEMGLNHINQMKIGDIDLYNYGDTGLTVAVEWTEGIKTNGVIGKKSDKYFAFDNPKLKMITNGVWEISIYPILPLKYRKQDVLFKYFIEFEDQMVQCNIIEINGSLFTYIHMKTTALKDYKNDLIFSAEYQPYNNWRRRLTKPYDNLGREILEFYDREKVFYQNNEVGEIVRNYMDWSDKSTYLV